MEWLLALVAGGGGVAALRYVGARRQVRREQQEELDGVRRLADEDVVVFGEQLQRLGEQVEIGELDSEGRADYQRALDAYESAQRTVHHLRDADEVSTVTDTLSTGRYALACVLARAAGRALPELRPPCFFNPQHGPSTRDVLWTTGRLGTRQVPACAQDAARVAAHEKPAVRTALIGNRRVPYWEAGAAYAPYSKGYFPAEAYLAVWAADVGPGWAGGWDMSSGLGGGDFYGGVDPGIGGDGGGF